MSRHVHHQRLVTRKRIQCVQRRKDTGNTELYGLSETVRTTQCLTCLRHRTIYCGCGKCLIPLQELDIFADPFLSSNEEELENAMDLKSGNIIIGEWYMLREIAGNETVHLLQEGGEMMFLTETISQNLDGLPNIACSWTTSRRSRSTTMLPEENLRTRVRCQFTKNL